MKPLLIFLLKGISWSIVLLLKCIAMLFIAITAWMGIFTSFILWDKYYMEHVNEMVDHIWHSEEDNS